MASPPRPQWLALHKVPRISADRQANDGFSVSRASPPSLSRLTVSAQLQLAAGIPPRVLVADLSAGLFLLPSTGKFYRVLYAANPTVGNPRRTTRDCWAFVDVIAHDGRLCWVQTLRTSNATSAGPPLLTCDNPFDDEPNLVFYRGSDSTLALCPLPSREACWNGEDASSSVARSRCVQVAGGKLRWVQMACRHAKESRQRGAPTVLMSTFLEDPKPGETEWSGVPHLRMSFADVWAHDSYRKTGLPREDPAAVVLIDPGKPSVVYFSLSGRIFGVDMLDNTVVGCEPHGMPEPDEDVSASSILAWVPPPARGLFTFTAPAAAPQQQEPPPPPPPQVLGGHQAATGEASGSGGVKSKEASPTSSASSAI